MRKIIFLKGAVLFSSISLVTLFLLFRVGFFDTPASKENASLQTSPNGGNITKTVIDTAKKLRDNTKSLIFSSSKVIILSDKNPFYKDSIKKKQSKYPPAENFPLIMSSSKSGSILDPKQEAALKASLDSLLKKASDSFINKIKKQQ